MKICFSLLLVFLLVAASHCFVIGNSFGECKPEYLCENGCHFPHICFNGCCSSGHGYGFGDRINVHCFITNVLRIE
ncbi:hypothetical protein L596_023705 [Steinernema carpocapsae]|uniref:Uncharacterized protein n=1 Tax=Steinernema carpocapsae TaxID=34508 RepID=A0A4U5MF80_STECR|nr:hypothetical protein L596_023705 [Steinernema carpocapsae]